MDDIIAYVKRNRFVFYIAIAICFGYTFGKDLAHKHNAEDALTSACTQTESLCND